MSGYRVIAARVDAADTAGRLFAYREGAHISWLNDKQRDHFLRRGLVEQVDAAGSSAVDDGLSAVVSAQPGYESPASVDVERPAQVASKEQWVEFAVASGIVRDEAEAMSKVDLIARLR